MAVDPTHLTSSYDNVDRTAYTTASISPTASRWLVIDVANAKAAVPEIPTVTGLSLTWTQEATVASAAVSQDRRSTRVYAWTGASPGSGALTITFSATQTGCAWIVYELGADVDTSDPFVQTATTSSDAAGTSASVALAAFGSANNRPLICAVHAANEVSTPEAGYTEIGDVNSNAPILGFAAAFHGSSTDTSPSYSWASSTTTNAAIASEIKAAASGGATVTPSAIAATVATPATGPSASSTISAATIATTTQVASGVGVSAGAGPGVIETEVAIPEAFPAVGSPETATPPGPIEAEVSMPQVTIDAATVVAPDAVAVVVALPGVIAGASATVTPATIASVVAFPQAALTASSALVPASLAVTATIPRPSPRITVIRFTVTSPTHNDWKFGTKEKPQDARYWDYFGPQPSGKTLIRNAGTWEAVVYPSTADIEAADDIRDENGLLRKAVLFGGHESRVSQAIASELEDQGFGAFISESEELVAA